MRRARLRPGITLLETLLVAGLLVAVAALVGVSVMAIPEAHKLPSAGDDIRGVMSGLRTRAMDDGQPWEFVFTPDTGNYSVRAGGDKANAPAANNNQQPGQLASDDLANHIRFDAAEIVGDHQLAAGLTFRAEPDGVSTMTADYGGVKVRGQLGSLPADGGTIRFMADGTCNTTSFLIEDAGGSRLRFVVRGLTGAITLQKLTADGQGRNQNQAGQRPGGGS